MTVKVGSAYGEMLLKYDQFMRGADLVEQRIARLQQLAAKPIAVPTLGGAGGGGGGGGGGSNLPAVRNTADAELRLNQQRARLIQVNQGASASEQFLTRIRQQSAGASERARLSLDLQIARLQKGTTLAQEFGQSFSSGIQSIIGPAALATAGVTALFGAVSAGVAAGGEALALREQQNSLRAVAGSAQLYAEAVNTARQQQLLFGGTIRENLDGIQGLTIVSKESGASLKQLIDLTQRLNLKSPEQGIGGARIAITEALSGNPTSLSRRFEIPKDQLKALADTSLPVADRLAAIDSYLNKIGITSQAVAGRVDADAAAFRRLNAELETTQLRVGDQLATAFGGAATGLARVIGLINENPQAIAELRAILGGRGSVTQEEIASTEEEVRRRQAREQTQRQLGGVGQAFASNPLLRATSAINPVAGAALGQLEGIGDPRANEELSRAVELLDEFNFAGGEAATQAANLAAQYQNGTIPSTTQLVAELERLKNTTSGVASPFSAAANAAVEAKNAFADQAVTSLKAATEAEKQRQVMSAIAQQSNFVLKGFITQAQGAAVLKGQLGEAADEALRLQLELGRAAAIQNQKDAPLDSATRSLIARGQAAAGGQGDASARLQKEKEFRDAQKQYQKDLLQFAPLAEQIRAKQRELSNFAADDPKRFGVQLELRRLQDQLERERLRTSKAHTSELDKQLSLEERIYDSQQKQYQAALDARLAANEDARQDILDEDQVRRLQNTAANATDPRFRRLAQLEIERIGLEDQKRGFELGQKLTTAGAPIVDGRLLQSLAGGGAPAGTPAPAGGGVVPGAAPASGGGGLPPVIIRIETPDGRVLAEIVEPFLWERIINSYSASRSSGGGQAQR